MGNFIKLKSLEITNYRNITHQVLNFNGDNSKVVGENRVGKTNTIEALYWLLTDRLINGSKDIEQLKPLDDTKKRVEVSATFFVDDKEISLGKTYEEDWVKTRGSEELVFKGHATIYFYNGVKQATKKTYDALFYNDFGLNITKVFQGIDIVQAISNPLYLGKMGDTDDWKNLRAMIIDIVGDVKDEDVFLSHPHLAKIKDDLARNMGRTDQVVKQYRDSIKGCEEDIIRCDGNLNMLNKVECPTQDAIEVAKKGIEDCDAKIHGLKTDNGNDKAIEIIDNEIITLKNQIIDEKRKLLDERNNNPTINKQKELNDKKVALWGDINKLTQNRSNLLTSIATKSATIESRQAKVQEHQAIRLDLIDALNSIDRELANPTFEKECPTCHREYNPDQLEEAKNNVIRSLTDKKLELINKGKDNTDKMKAIVKNVENLKFDLAHDEEELERIETSIELANNQVKDIDKELESLVAAAPSNGEITNAKIKELEDKILAKNMEKNDLKVASDISNESIRSMVAQEQAKKETFQKVLNEVDYYNRTQDQIKEVSTKKSTLNQTLIALEQNVESVKEFIKIKLQMLDENIAKVFDDVSFMLIEPQINGGYATVCKPYIKGTNTLWKSGSKSEQITTGVAIAEKIKAALGLSNFPYIFDEGGEVSTDTFKTRFETECQLICVQVKDGINMPTVMKI